ncbi:hypothetical protein DL546_008272 [Coniochaeta pulveracea]|uniref:Uncharacterized protein n=1 Tax=Coniochaeta pulveracea TaxID=177199 RepID=A0A420YCI7_9PEZI|nr:hypothetical protein DL546_008272 [Coniochaeta pulveracea]
MGGPNLIERIQQKLELIRLEKRYTRRRNRRSTFVSNAVYVDGEYIYNTPNSTGSSTNSRSTTQSPKLGNSSPPSPTTSSPADDASKAQKRVNRWSSMPGFGSLSKGTTSRNQDWRTAQVDVAEVR